MARTQQSSLIAALISVDLSLAHLLAAKITFILTGISWSYSLACSPCPALVHMAGCRDDSCDQFLTQEL